MRTVATLLMLALAGCASGTKVVETKDGDLVEQACATGGDKAKNAALGAGLTAVLGAGLAPEKRGLGALIGGAFGGGAGWMIGEAEACPDEAEAAVAATPKPLFKQSAGEVRTEEFTQ